MQPVQNFPFFCIMLSMVSGVVCVTLRPRQARALSLASIAAVACMSLLTLRFTVSASAPFVYLMGHFPAPFGNEIRVGVLEALMASFFSVVLLLSLLGGMSHLLEDVDEKKQSLYFMMIQLLFCSMLAIIYTNDLFTAYVFVEINTLTSCSIVMLKHSKETLAATVRYLIMSLLGSGLFLIGICILYDVSGHLLMSPIRESVARLASEGRYTFPLEMTVCLFAAGMAIKSALYPFHTWLPDAHGSATTASSAILSGLVLKAYIILLIKIFHRVIGMNVILRMRILNVLFLFGVCAMVMGSLKALQEKDIKRMIAYSSVAQIGYIYAGIGLGSVVGMCAACFQIIAHAVTKPMLFCAAGGLMEESGESRQFEKLRGAALRAPAAGAAFTVGSLSMIGLPFLAGFITKLRLAMAAVVAPGKGWLLLAVLALSTLLNALYYVRALLVLYRKEDGAPAARSFRLPFALVMASFAALNLLCGLASQPILAMIRTGLERFG